MTEQDVVNEEMYEEEDDDLPMQYRRLTAHLQTGSDFNRRLAAYLTNHVAMRSALDQAITNSYAQQYPNAPQFAHNPQKMYPSPMIPQNMMQQPAPQSYRQSPYPMPRSAGFRPQPHVRAASIAGPHEIPGYSQSVSTSSPVEVADQNDLRRTSMPAPSTSPTASRTPQPLQPSPSRSTAQPSTSSFSVKQEPQQSKQMQAPPVPQQSQQQPPPPPPQQQSQQLQQQPPSQQQFMDMNKHNEYSSPFTTALPAEAQMFLGPVLDPSDPFTSMLMAGSENVSQPYYSYNTGTSAMKGHHFHPSYDGMSSTLAPSALDMSPHFSYSGLSSASSTSTETLATPALAFGFEASGIEFKTHNVTGPGSAHGSGNVTPSIDNGWDSFINDNSWVENVT